MWKVAEKIGDQEGRLDFCVAAAGINKPEWDCLEYPADVWSEVRHFISLLLCLKYLLNALRWVTGDES
jgi:hypothetical protein